jgi:hypothetical protein
LTKEHTMRASRKHRPDAKVAALRKLELLQGGSESVLNAPHHDRLRRRAIIGGFSALLLVLSLWLVPVLGFVLIVLAVLVLNGIVAPEPIDTYFDVYFDRHGHARW